MVISMYRISQIHCIKLLCNKYSKSYIVVHLQKTVNPSVEKN